MRTTTQGVNMFNGAITSISNIHNTRVFMAR